MFDWINVLGFAGSTLGAVMVVPQVLRAARSTGPSGISINTWTMVAVACSAWILYGVWCRQWPQLLALVTLAGALAIIVIVSARNRVRVAPRLALLGVAVGGLVGLTVIAGPAATGIAASAVGVFAALPQLVACLKAAADRSAAGSRSSVSSATWLVYGLSQVFWLAFGIGVGDLIVIGYSVIVLALATGIVTAQRSRAQVDAAPAVRTADPIFATPVERELEFTGSASRYALGHVSG